MGIDYDGSMIIGADVDDMDLSFIGDKDLIDWIEENGMDYMAPYYDASSEYWTIGFKVDDVDVSSIDVWVVHVKEMAGKFTALTGHPAKLIGMQNIW